MLLFCACHRPRLLCDSESLDCLLAVRSCRCRCRCYRVVACVCLVQCVATPILDCLPASLSASVPRQLHLLFALGTGFGQQDSASQSNHLTRPTIWGMSCCSKSSDNPTRAHYSRSEPRGLSHILNPSGDTQQHVVSGRSFDAYEENGRLYHAWRRGTYPYPTDEVSHPASPAAYTSEAQRRCSENEADTIWCITWCIALS